MIEVFIFAFNRPDLLGIQIDCLDKFLANDFAVNVIQDTRNHQFVEEFKTSIAKVSEKYPDRRFVYYEHESPDGLQSSEYHSNVLQWTQDNLVSKLSDSKVLFLDHDMFLIEDLDLLRYLEQYDIVGLLQTREHINYIWPGLVAFNTNSVNEVNWKCGKVEGQSVDSGGGTYTLLRNPNIRFRDTGAEYPNSYKNLDLTDSAITHGYNFELHFDGKFLHTRNASNWDTMYNVKDLEKTDLMMEILKDVLKNKTKKQLEIVVSRYDEDLEWAEDYLNYCTIYNKGEQLAIDAISLPNIGREGHTFVKHIVDNYDNLADHTIFLQGEPIDPHSPNLKIVLDVIINFDSELADFLWISERLVEGDFEYIREPYHKIVPNIKYAYEKVFGEQPKLETFVFGSGAQFCVSRRRIHKRPVGFYKNILDIFEHDSGEALDELSLKLLGNPGDGTVFQPINPEFGLHLERFWGLILN